MKDAEHDKREYLQVDEGSPWSVEILSSCLLAGAGESEPLIRFSVFFSGKLAVVQEVLDRELLTEGWESHARKSATVSIDWLVARGVVVPDGFLALLEKGAARARMCSIRSLVRFQAARLIQFVPASEACFIWSETEALHVISS